MRNFALALMALTLLLFVSTANAKAAKFSFDPGTGGSAKQADLSLPAALIVIASLVGVFLMILERKKARGIWFSNSETMK
ncbi:MAG TPA: hypothetical protein VLA68_07235 [Nitrososphaera sp.]|nr:hypothetical protein [Nitrososphaera sp.]